MTPFIPLFGTLLFCPFFGGARYAFENAHKMAHSKTKVQNTTSPKQHILGHIMAYLGRFRKRPFWGAQNDPFWGPKMRPPKPQIWRSKMTPFEVQIDPFWGAQNDDNRHMFLSEWQVTAPSREVKRRKKKVKCKSKKVKWQSEKRKSVRISLKCENQKCTNTFKNCKCTFENANVKVFRSKHTLNACMHTWHCTFGTPKWPFLRSKLTHFGSPKWW